MSKMLSLLMRELRIPDMGLQTQLLLAYRLCKAELQFQLFLLKSLGKAETLDTF